MQSNSTIKKPDYLYSDDFELDMAVYLLPHLWWGAAMYGRSLSNAYTRLGRRDDEMISGVANTFYRHFLGSMLGMSYELALKALLISLDDPPDHRVGFPKKHDLCLLWSVVPYDVQTEIERDAKQRGVQQSLADWFAQHGAFLSVDDRYPQTGGKDRQKWQTTARLLLPRPMTGDLIGQMEVIFDCIMQAMKGRYFSDDQAELSGDELDRLRADMAEFDGLQHTRNHWSHLWGAPVVRPPKGTSLDRETFTGGDLVGYQLDVTLMEQGQEAAPKTVPKLWWIPVGTKDVHEFTDANVFNGFVRQQVKGEPE